MPQKAASDKDDNVTDSARPLDAWRVSGAELDSGSSLLDKLRAEPDAEDEEYVNPWVPATDGEGIEGIVTKIGQYVDDKYDQEKVYRTVVIQTDEGLTWSIIPFHRMLRSELIKNRPDVGDRLAILYVGEKQSTTDPEQWFKVYRVAKVSAARLRRAARSSG